MKLIEVYTINFDEHGAMQFTDIIAFVPEHRKEWAEALARQVFNQSNERVDVGMRWIVMEPYKTPCNQTLYGDHIPFSDPQPVKTFLPAIEAMRLTRMKGKRYDNS